MSRARPIALANRIAVLEEGRIVQADIVDEMRRAPATQFVRQFWNEFYNRSKVEKIRQANREIQQKKAKMKCSN